MTSSTQNKCNIASNIKQLTSVFESFNQEITIITINESVVHTPGSLWRVKSEK